ncbi:TonB-dependent receptor [Mucilaginibacter sp.]
MKRIFTLIAIFCIALSAKAQFGIGGGGGSTTVGRISGTVIDSVTKKPLDYATISLFRSGGKAPLNGVITDAKGNFKLDNIKAGSYKITIGFIGYNTKTIDPVTTTPGKPDANVGRILISPNSRALKEVVVAGKTSLVENRIDKIVYNAEKDITSVGGNATDVLQKVPLVAVDMNGNISLRGDNNVRVLINGKPSGAMAASLSDVLKTIPADQIKTIEVITSPSAKYDAEGSAGIINIVTKQKNLSGISGSVSGGIGTRQNNGNINFNYNKNRFNFSANIGGNYTWPQTSRTVSDQFLVDSATQKDLVHNYSNNTSRIKRYGVRGSLTAGYEFNSYNSLNSTLTLNDGGFNLNGGGTYNQEILTNTALNKIYYGNTTSHNHFGGFDWNVDYTRKFKKEGEELDISGQWSHSDVNTDYTNRFSDVNPSQNGSNNGKNNEYTLQLDYTLPVSKVFKLEAGGKTIQRRLSSDYNIFSTDYAGSFFTHDDINSNQYNYHQNVYAGYTVLTFTLPKGYAVMPGFRLENTAITGNPSNTSQVTTTNQMQNLRDFTQNYNTFIPSLTIQKTLSATQTLKLSYSKRIQRPDLQSLNPFINRSSVQAQSVGNPELGPQTTQSVELNYNTFIKSSVLNFSVYYRHTNGLFESIASRLVEVINGDTIRGTRSTTNNVASNNSFGASLFGSVSPVKNLTLRASLNGYTYHPSPYSQYTLNASALGTYFQFSAFGSASYEFNHGIIAEFFGFDNSSRRTIQGTNPAFGIYAFGVKKQFANKRASLGFNTVQPFANDKHFDSSLSGSSFRQSSSTAFPFRSFGITFSYSFGKLSFSNPQQKKKGINNDDVSKQGDQGGAPTGNPAGQ